MLITLYFSKNKLTLEGDLEDVRRTVESGKVKDQLVPFKGTDNLITYVSARNVDMIQAHEVYVPVQAPKPPEAPKQERIVYTEEQLAAQPLLALDAYGQRRPEYTQRG